MKELTLLQTARCDETLPVGAESARKYNMLPPFELIGTAITMGTATRVASGLADTTVTLPRHVQPAPQPAKATSKAGPADCLLISTALHLWHSLCTLLCMEQPVSNTTQQDAACRWELLKEQQNAQEAAWAAYRSEATLSLHKAHAAAEAAAAHASELLTAASSTSITTRPITHRHDDGDTGDDDVGAAWAPLASSPAALTAFVRRCGVRSLRFVDVLALDAEFISELPVPCAAFVLLYPTSNAAQAYLDANPTLTATGAAHSAEFLLSQKRGGTCGTIAALHAVVNGARALAKSPEALLGPSLCMELQIISQGEHHQHDEGEPEGEPEEGRRRLRELRSQRLLSSSMIRDAHDRCAAATSAARGRVGERQGRHFVALVRARDRLVMCDGRRIAPLDCGPTSSTSFSRDVANLVAGLVAACEQETASLAFSLMALVPYEP
jgi:hypothetical protein